MTVSSAVSVESWSAFVDSYDVSVSTIVSLLHRLYLHKDLPTQRRIVDDVEQAVFDCKRQIEDVSALISTFPQELRARALSHVAQYKAELEEHYSLLLHYQHAHRQGLPFVISNGDRAAVGSYVSDDPSAALLSESTAAGSYTVRTLSGQSASLARQLDAVMTAADTLSQSERAVDTLRRTLTNNRRAQCIIIFAECIIIGILIYLKFLK